MVHLEAENGKEQIYFHRDNTLTECVICVKKCELEQMITNFLICSKIQLKWVQEVWECPILRYSPRKYTETERVNAKMLALFAIAELRSLQSSVIADK